MRRIGRVSRRHGFRGLRERWHPHRLEALAVDGRGRWGWRTIAPEDFVEHAECLATLAQMRALTETPEVVALRTPAEHGCEPKAAKRVIAAARRWARR